MLLGFFVALKLNNISIFSVWMSVVISFIALCFVVSANYGINEVFDADSDSHHPQKHVRAVASGKIKKGTVIIFSVLFYFIGFFLVRQLNNFPLMIVFLFMFFSGIFYNIPPIRIKDIPYADFIFEAVNSPIRLLIGWYSVTNSLIPVSFIFTFWFIGVFLMAAKRFAEIRFINDPLRAQFYRKSLGYYTEKKLLFTMIAAISAAMFMFGVLVAKYQISLVLLLPFFIVFIVWFFSLAYDKDSIVKDPERVFEKKWFVLYTCALLIVFLLLIQYPMVSFNFLIH